MGDFLLATPTVLLSVAVIVQAFKEKRLRMMALHLASLLLTCLLVANVQIVTRMVLSASPLFIWGVESFISRKNGRWILLYWMGYYWIGSVMFSLFLPWTFLVCYNKEGTWFRLEA